MKLQTNAVITPTAPSLDEHARSTTDEQLYKIDVLELTDEISERIFRSEYISLFQ